ncbi:MAG: AraC family transcriptional regulator [Clostridiales bacterium]|nr:AraC family transcriptional regulator [Clostridiales bacterium]
MQKSEGDRIITTPSPYARQHYLYVQEVGFLKSVEPHISSRKDLESYLFFLVLSGRGTFHCNGIPYELKQGNCVWVDCRLPYSHESSKESPWELKWVHFNGLEASSFYEAFESRENRLVFAPSNPGLFNETLSNLFTLHKKDCVGKEILSHKYLTDIMTGCLLENTESAGKSEGIQEKLDAMREYMKSHFKEDITLDRLSELFFISKYHLAREYKQAFGITPGNDLTVIRISEAKSLLRFTAEPVSHIARLCGYPDANYFTKVFRKSEGITPLEYRRKW